MLGTTIRRLWKPGGVCPGGTLGTGPGPECPGPQAGLVLHVHPPFFFGEKLLGALQKHNLRSTYVAYCLCIRLCCSAGKTKTQLSFFVVEMCVTFKAYEFCDFHFWKKMSGALWSIKPVSAIVGFAFKQERTAFECNRNIYLYLNINAPASCFCC